MKTRTGFVSNSSSSSFVIGLKKTPKTWSELHQLLFGTMDVIVLRPDWSKPTDESYETFFVDSTMIAENMFNQIVDQTPLRDSQLEKVCDPGRTPNFPDGDRTPAGKKLVEHMLEKYGVAYPYALSPTNHVCRKLRAIDDVLRKKYHAECARRSKAAWQKLSPRFKGLKKFVIMTQTDGGKEGRILAFMEYCWKIIAKNIPNVKLTSH